MGNIQELRAFAELNGIPFVLNKSLREHTTFRLGGPADIFLTPQNADQLALLQSHLQQNAVGVFVLGGGSNILVSDAGFRGAVVHPQFGEEPAVTTRTPDRLEVKIPASARAPLAGKRISAMGFVGLEFLTTIPGHFGGSVIQNAGCYGHELRDSVLSVEAVRQGQIINLPARDCAFAYRDSLFKHNPDIWIAGATLELQAGDPVAIAGKISEFKERRIASQPGNRRSAGSIFKNPAASLSSKKAWQLIDEAGLRGVREGGAEISAEHCNFIVNDGNATASAVLSLIRLIEKRVMETSGVRLEREVVLLGFDEP